MQKKTNPPIDPRLACGVDYAKTTISIDPKEPFSMTAPIRRQSIGRFFLLPFLCAPLAMAATQDTEQGFRPLFNGRDLSGWAGDTKGYTVNNGELVCKSGGNLFTNDIFGDFILRFEFKLTPGANNGLGIRVPPRVNDAAYGAIELQILENTAAKYRTLKSYQYHGSVYGVVPAKRGHLRPVGEWNEQVVVAEGYHLTVVLNGAVILEADIEEASKDGTMDGRKHPGLLRRDGRIGFLGHGDRVYFRNIRIKPLG